MQQEFFRFGEVQPLGFPAERTLRNRLDAISGEVRFGGGVPPLRTILLGGSRVILRRDLEAWLDAVAVGPTAPTAQAVSQGSTAPTAQPLRRGRGRPRKSSQVSV